MCIGKITLQPINVGLIIMNDELVAMFVWFAGTCVSLSAKSDIFEVPSLN